ncbi:hypothetical protein [Variovorax sp. Sphag1AA]|uniref:hypothetical protein n=1 Tax=Variovorax sp. Sphag1AA TaxID=2587027 RepID=UPI00161E376E|nr:hypothetical protein [Variovorax sp. Sphag1AA]MBB3176249.1 hypothetical protein [Variovorax sp. Sphag1AA]
MSDTNVLAEALTLLQQQVERERAEAQAELDRAHAAVAAAAERVRELQTKRDAVVAQIALFGASLPPISGVVRQTLAPATMVATAEITTTRKSRREWRSDLIGRLERLLAGGRRMSAEAILQSLKEQGVSFDNIANERHRLVQIMSDSEVFDSDRKRGWGLAAYKFPAIDEDRFEAHGEVAPTLFPPVTLPPYAPLAAPPALLPLDKESAADESQPEEPEEPK